MARALVLGATGHIGSHIVRALLADGHSVRAAYRNDRYLSLLEELPVEKVRVDLEEPEGNGLKAALKGCEWVFHAAGYYPSSREGREAAIRKGTESTRRLLEIIRQADPIRIVFTSSAATIRIVPGRLANENDAEDWPPSGRRSLYAAVKIGMEREALEFARRGLPIVVVNPTLCIGEYDAHTFSGRAVLAYARHRVPFFIEASFNVVYTGDVGVGHLKAAQRGRVGHRYLLTGQNVTLKEFGTLVARAAGVPPPRWRVPHAVALGSASILEMRARLTGREPLYTRQEIRMSRQGYLLDGTKAVQELGVPQTSVEEAVQRALDWFRRNGTLKG